jgi:uncharacterized DUF497 family protein
MEFEFDPAKDEANRFKHGLKLMFGRRVFDDPEHIISTSFRRWTARIGARRSVWSTANSTPRSMSAR